MAARMESQDRKRFIKKRPQRLCVNSALVVVLGVVIIYLIPSPIDPEPISLSKELPVLQGPYAVNTHLHSVEKLFEGKLLGPESFAAAEDGSIYTGTADGKVWRIRDGELELVARTGLADDKCGTYNLEPECGRPKGMKVDNSGRLIVADAYQGILSIDLDTGKITPLLQSFNGSRFQFLNGLDISRDGIIYVTESSTKWARRDYRYEVIETNCGGRILAYNQTSRQAWVVQDGLYLANGLSLTLEEDALLVAEMSVSRISKVYIKGAKTGQKEVLIWNLPGYPDNIKRNAKGNYYVGMGSVRFQGSSPIGSFLDLVGPYPGVKKTITKLIPAPFFDNFLPKHTILVEFSPSGEILSSHHDPGAFVLPALSEAFQHGENVYIGHFKIPFIGVIKSYKLSNE